MTPEKERALTARVLLFLREWKLRHPDRSLACGHAHFRKEVVNDAIEALDAVLERDYPRGGGN